MKIKGLFHNSGIGSKILQIAGISLFSMLLFFLISMLITGGDLSDINSIKLAQFIQSFGIFIISPFLMAYLWGERPLEYLRIDKAPAFTQIIPAVIIMLLAIPAINLLGEMNHAISFPESLSWLENQLIDLEQRAEKLTNDMLKVNDLTGLLINLGLIAVIPALGEELFFRGIIQQVLQSKYKTDIAVWLTAFIFSAIHFQFFGFIPRMLLGALLGYLFVWSKNIWVPVAAHFSNNAAAVLFYYFKGEEKHNLNLENIGSSETCYLGLISIAAVMLLTYYFRKKFNSCSKN